MKKNLNNKIFSLKIYSVTSFLILLITITLTVPIQAQIPELSSKELKQLKEAEELKTEAEELQLKANELYLEASVLKQDEEYDISKKLQKEAENLEKEALKSEEEAAELFEKSTEIKKEIYEDAIEEFWENFDGDQSDYTNAKLIQETAEEYFFRAEEIRRDAAKMKDEQEAILKQNEAYELELMALEKLTNAYDIYKYGPSGVVTYPEEPVTYNEPEVDTSTSALNTEEQTPASPTTPEEHIMETGEQVKPEQGEVNVDQQQLDMILGSIQRSEMAGDTAEFYPRNLFSSFDTESLRKSMEQYQSMEMPETEASVTEEPQVSEVYEEPVMKEPLPEPEEVITEGVQEETKPETVQPDEPVEIGRVEERIVPDPDSEIIYKVQIAADRAPLSQNVLKKLYYGDREMERINEDGWYKYSIGDFETFEEADQYRKSLGVKDAFVVAYRGSKRLRDYQQQAMEEPVTETRIEHETPPVAPTTEVSPATNQVNYVVQIAASKTPMEESHLTKIYSGNKQINTRREDGWYKYQIGQTPVYEEARETLQNVNVNGAFIAAYRNNERVGFGRITNRNVSPSEPLFVLQIAASKKQLSSKQIEKIYQGNYNVREIEEDGWYKYQIPAGATYNDARRLKNLLKINGAFTVAYVNNKKIDIRKAIEMTK